MLFIKLSWGNYPLFLLFPLFHSLVHRSLQIAIPKVLPLLALFFKVDDFSEESQVLTQSLSLVSLAHVHSSLSLLHSCWSTKQLVSLQDDDSLTYTFYLVLFPGLCFPWWTPPSEVLYCISLNTCSKVKDVQSKTFTALNNLFRHICIFKWHFHFDSFKWRLFLLQWPSHVKTAQLCPIIHFPSNLFLPVMYLIWSERRKLKMPPRDVKSLLQGTIILGRSWSSGNLVLFKTCWIE